MKTTKTTKAFSNKKKMDLHASAIALFFLLSVMLTQSQDLHSSSSNSDEDLLRFLTKVEPEALLQVEPWMLDFNILKIADIIHPKIIRVQESEFTPDPELIVEIWMEDMKSWHQDTYFTVN